jgi:hypothetical protein
MGAIVIRIAIRPDGMRDRLEVAEDGDIAGTLERDCTTLGRPQDTPVR